MPRRISQAEWTEASAEVANDFLIEMVNVIFGADHRPTHGVAVTA